MDEEYGCETCGTDEEADDIRSLDALELRDHKCPEYRADCLYGEEDSHPVSCGLIAL